MTRTVSPDPDTGGDADAPPAPLTIAVSGSTGLIGSALIRSLRADGHRIRRLVRTEAAPGGQHVFWDPDSRTLDPRALDGVDAIVHLAGENVGERWSEEKKRRIRDSRIKGTQLLAAAAVQAEPRPRVMVSASGVGIYGDRGDELLDESSEPGRATDFFAALVRDWEAATEPAERHGVRVVKTRFGAMISSEGGPVGKMLLPFRLGAGGKIGSGRQWMSWIALADAIDAIRFLLFDSDLAGPVNVTSPNPVRNADFTKAFGRALNRPAFMTVPATALRIAFGEMADATVLVSQRAVPKRLLEAGFRFRYPEIEAALRAELGRG